MKLQKSCNDSETESIGIEDPPKCQQNFKLEDQFSDISFNGNFYEVGLPWKHDCQPSSDNWQMCETRLKFVPTPQIKSAACIIKRVPQHHSRTRKKQ